MAAPVVVSSGRVDRSTVLAHLEQFPGQEARDRVGVEHTVSGWFDCCTSHVHEPLLFERLDFPREVADWVTPEERPVIAAIDSQRGEAAGQVQDPQVLGTVLERAIPGRPTPTDGRDVLGRALRVDHLDRDLSRIRERDAGGTEADHVVSVGAEAQLFVDEPPVVSPELAPLEIGQCRLVESEVVEQPPELQPVVGGHHIRRQRAHKCGSRDQGVRRSPANITKWYRPR